MPVKNYFPVFHKLKSGAYSYSWTDKCERLLPKHYKQRCLDYMKTDPEPVHWKPDLGKYTINKYGERYPVQNHPIHVRYPDQCNQGLWAGEGVVFCFLKYQKKMPRDRYVRKCPKMYVPSLTTRVLYSEILDKWISCRCTARALDLIDDAFGLDNYILKTHERHLNSRFAMVLRRKMLIALAKNEVSSEIAKKYEEFKIPLEEAEWIGLSTKEALELAESQEVTLPSSRIKKIAHEQIIREYAAARDQELLQTEPNEQEKSKEQEKVSTVSKIKQLIKW